MPKLACRACGRQIYTVATLDSLFAEERRCPRCGAFLESERRETTGARRSGARTRPTSPGRPTATERRVAERRTTRRRVTQQ